MATQQISLTADWINITSSLALVSGTNYLLQNTGANNIYIVENSSDPSATTTGIVLRVGSDGLQFQQSTDSLYARSGVSNSVVTVTESYTSSSTSDAVERSGDTTDGNLAVWNGDNVNSIRDGGPANTNYLNFTGDIDATSSGDIDELFTIGTFTNGLTFEIKFGWKGAALQPYISNTATSDSYGWSWFYSIVGNGTLVSPNPISTGLGTLAAGDGKFLNNADNSNSEWNLSTNGDCIVFTNFTISLGSQTCNITGSFTRSATDTITYCVECLSQDNS